MSGKKKNRKQSDPSKVITLITAILNLVIVLIKLINDLIE